MALPHIDMKATGKCINDLRIKRELTVRDIQQHFEVQNPQMIYKWINGKSIPNIDNLVILADLLGCKIDDILVIKG